jgi:hypothetical protein
LYQFVSIETIAPSLRVLLDAADGFEDVVQAAGIVLHRG